MAEIVPSSEASSTLEALFGRFENVVNMFYERGDIVEDNKIQLARIQRKSKNIQQLLPRGRSDVEHNIHAKVSLKELEWALQVELERVASIESVVSSAKRANRVKRMRQIMNNCEKAENKLLEFLRDNQVPMPYPHSCSDYYTPMSNVPSNPPRLTLDYSSNCTDEGKLKSIILGRQNQRIIALIASGQGGVGKTCALRGLADDDDIKARFFSGILYIQLGNDAKIADIIQGLANIVVLTGGKQLAKDIKSLEKLQDACDTASTWFHSQTCLFLIDDIWKVNGINADTIDILGKVVHENSRMVYTSRDKYFLNHVHGSIDFKVKKPDEILAKRMLLTHAEFREADLDSFTKENHLALNAILNECQGLPLALGITGGAVLSRSREFVEDEKQKVWSDYWADMQKYSNMYDFLKTTDFDTRLRRIVDLSLVVLNKRQGKEFSSLFRSLCVLRKQQSVSTSVLQKLWNLGSLDETEAIVNEFYNVALVQTSKRKGTRYVQLHDLVLDIAKYEAFGLEEVKGFYNLLITNYSRLGGTILFGTPNHTSAPEVKTIINEADRKQEKRTIKWWNISADGYIHENICNLLHCGEKIDELLWLLSQPEWIMHRLLIGGVLQVEADVKEGIVALENFASSDERREHLETIVNAVRLSGPYVYRNPPEVWFQLYGRLQWHGTKNKWTELFIRRIELAAPRPWVKAPVGVVQQASLDAHSVMKSKGDILCIRLDKDVLWFVWEGGSEIGVASWDTNTGNEEAKELDTKYFEESGCFENDFGAKFWASFSADGSNVIVVHSSLRIGIFRTETGESEKRFHLHGSSNTPKRNIFTCCLPSSKGTAAAIPVQNRIVAISKDGKYLATSNHEHDVQIWSAANGEAIGPPLYGHMDEVVCVAINEDGTLVVAGGVDNTIWLWNAKSGDGIGRPLRGHTNTVMCLTLSTDSNQVVSGASDNSVLLWDVTSGKPIGDPFLGDEDWVISVSMSEDGKTIVSGSVDGTVIVWDVQNGVMKGLPLRGHTRRIHDVEISEDGGIAASAARDCAVRVWKTRRNERLGEMTVENENRYRRGVMSGDGIRYVYKTGEQTAKIVDARSGKAVGPSINFDIESVLCMGMSADNSRGVFGLNGGKLIVFDPVSGNTIGKPLQGHKDWVRCVAMMGDGNVIVSGSNDGTVRIWDTKSGKSTGKRLVDHSGEVNCVAVSPNVSRVVSGSRYKTVRVWDAESGEAIGGPLRGHTDWVNCVGMSADGMKVLSGSDDRTVRVWDVQSSQQIAGPFQHESSVYCLGFDDEVSKIATICRDGTHKLWDVASGSCTLTSMGCQWNAQVDRLSLSWNGRFDFVKRKQIIDIDKNGKETVLATTDVDVFHGPGSDIYFSDYSDPLEVVR